MTSYTEDSEIVRKLKEFNVEVVSPIRRVVHHGTNVSDGTRVLKAKFPDNLVSLPYTMKFSNKEFVKVVHNNQIKVCSLCASPSHLFRNCPQFRCYRCKAQGHYIRQCTTNRCVNCRSYRVDCGCSSRVDVVKVSICDQCGLFNCQCEGDGDNNRCVDCDKRVCICDDKVENDENADDTKTVDETAHEVDNTNVNTRIDNTEDDVKDKEDLHDENCEQDNVTNKNVNVNSNDKIVQNNDVVNKSSDENTIDLSVENEMNVDMSDVPSCVKSLDARGNIEVSNVADDMEVISNDVNENKTEAVVLATGVTAPPLSFNDANARGGGKMKLDKLKSNRVHNSSLVKNKNNGYLEIIVLFIFFHHGVYCFIQL